MSDWPEVAVIGGSIGGLTAALALRELGCDVMVYERSAVPLEARGAGIGLHPMTIRYFTEYDPLDTVNVVIELPWLRFLDKSGQVTYREVMNYQFSSWTTIYRHLLRNFDTDRYHLAAEVTSFERSPTGAEFTLIGGQTRQTDLLVCADGIASMARTVLQPAATPQYAGYVAWRGVVPESQLSAVSYQRLHDAITYGLLPAGHVLVYPIPGWNSELAPGQRLMNFVWYHNYQAGDELDALMTDRDGQQRPLSLPPGMVQQCYIEWLREYADEHMAPAIAEVIAKTEQPFVQVIFDIEVAQMAFDNIALIGDGAYAVRPHAAAGTAKACADAWTLRDALQAHNGDVGAALRAWEPGQLALGRQLLQRTRDIGDRSQFACSWVPGDPSLRFGLYGPGR